MDLQAYHIQAAEAAAAAAVHAEDDDDVVELSPKAVLLKLEVEAGMADLGASSNGSGLSPFLWGGNAEAGSSGRDLTCPECGKTFLSDKAMYGHLRSHPERGYKGAIRPATASLAAVAGDKKPTRKVPRKKAGESPATDLSATPAAVVGEKNQREEDELRTRWPATAKRGRASSTPISAGSAPAAAAQSSSWCSGDEEAAMILLEMASGGGTASEAQQSRQPVRTRDAKHQIPEVYNEQPMLLDHVAQNQMTPELPQLMTPDHVAFEAQQQIPQPELSPEVIIVESQTPEVKELTEELEIPTKAVVVVVREKSGAKKHKKRRGNPYPEQMPETESPEAANVKPPVSDNRPECLICGKSFPTHQALGGHMAGHKYNKGDDPALVQAMLKQNILVHRRQRSNAIVGGTGQEDPATGMPREVAVPAASQDQECHDVQLPAVPVARHACADCNMTFRSGQALGGHMRKHWFAGKQQARAALAAAPLNFDLNELPNDAEGEHQP